MKRSLLILLFVFVLMFALVGCGGSKKDAPAKPAKEAPAKVIIVDKRIIGAWEGKDGNVEFKSDGNVVLDDGTQLPFAMPSSEQLKITFPGGTQVFTVKWKGDDKHGIVSKDSTDTTVYWYDRKK
jgi:hypothetical protein